MMKTIWMPRYVSRKPSKEWSPCGRCGKPFQKGEFLLFHPAGTEASHHANCENPTSIKAQAV